MLRQLNTFFWSLLGMIEILERLVFCFLDLLTEVIVINLNFWR